MSFTYVIADLHGRFDLLEMAIDAIMRWPPSHMPGTIVTLGDYIDRGPQSRQIIDQLIKGSTATGLATEALTRRRPTTLRRPVSAR